MNKKLVIVWSSIVCAFILIGLYGLANVDRLVDDGVGGKIFLGDGEHLRKCTYNTETANITYNFIVEDNNSTISRMVITYKNNKPSADNFKFSKNIADTTVTGIASKQSGQTDNFNLVMNIDMQTYTGDDAAISTNLVSMNILLEKVTKYETYILDLSKSYTNDIKNLACS